MDSGTHKALLHRGLFRLPALNLSTLWKKNQALNLESSAYQGALPRGLYCQLQRCRTPLRRRFLVIEYTIYTI